MPQQPGTPTETVINHSGVVPDPVDPLSDVPLPTAGRGPTLLERLRGMIRGSGGAFNPRMIALFIGGGVLFLVALGLFVKQSPGREADERFVGPTKPVEVKKDSTYKSAPPVVAAPKEGGDQTARQNSEEKQDAQIQEHDTHTSSPDDADRDRARHETDGPVVQRGPGEERESDARTLPPRERRYAVDYEAAPPVTEQIAKASETEPTSGQLIAAGAASGQSVQIAPVQLEQGPVLPRGLRIKMELVDPFQSGLSAMVRARVLEDVRLKDGKLLVPANVEVYLPMLELAVATPDNKGRVVVNPKPSEDEMGFISIGEESRIMIKGTAYGADNLAGLPGKRTKVNGGSRFSALKRLGARASGALSSMSPVPIYGIESEIARDSYSYERTQFIVSVAARTRFTFVVGL